MRHFYLLKEPGIVSLIAILLSVGLSIIIALMWIRIDHQEKIISELRIKVSDIECGKKIDKATIHRMYLHDLFEEIDKSEKR